MLSALTGHYTNQTSHTGLFPLLGRSFESETGVMNSCIMQSVNVAAVSSSTKCCSSNTLSLPLFSYPVSKELVHCQKQPVLRNKSRGVLTTLPFYNENKLSFRKDVRFTQLYSSSKTAEDSFPANVSPLESLYNSFDAFHRFSRPHTVIGTVIGIISISLLAVQSLAELSPAFFVGLLKALIPSLFMNIYIVGLNQISDIEIDKINKPYLPLASGEYSLETAVGIVTACAVMSLAMGFKFQSSSLLCALVTSFILGTAYSIDLPFLRWKRSAFAAATCILCVRAVVVQIAFYMHIQSSVYIRPAIMTKPVIFATAFMCFFSVVIALFKDIPDVNGDRIFGIRSFSVRLGAEKVFWLCIYLLLAAYSIAITMGVMTNFWWTKLGLVVGHALLAANLWQKALITDIRSKGAITSFYMFIWKLFYAEYFLIPFMR